MENTEKLQGPTPEQKFNMAALSFLNAKKEAWLTADDQAPQQVDVYFHDLSKTVSRLARGGIDSVPPHETALFMSHLGEGLALQYEESPNSGDQSFDQDLKAARQQRIEETRALFHFVGDRLYTDIKEDITQVPAAELTKSKRDLENIVAKIPRLETTIQDLDTLKSELTIQFYKTHPNEVKNKLGHMLLYLSEVLGTESRYSNYNLSNGTIDEKEYQEHLNACGEANRAFYRLQLLYEKTLEALEAQEKIKRQEALQNLAEKDKTTSAVEADKIRETLGIPLSSKATPSQEELKFDPQTLVVQEYLKTQLAEEQTYEKDRPTFLPDIRLFLKTLEETASPEQADKSQDAFKFIVETFEQIDRVQEIIRQKLTNETFKKSFRKKYPDPQRDEHNIASAAIIQVAEEFVKPRMNKAWLPIIEDFYTSKGKPMVKIKPNLTSTLERVYNSFQRNQLKKRGV